MPEQEKRERRVLVLAPTGRDGVLITEMLASGNLPCRVCLDVPTLASDIAQGAGLAVLAEEALIGTGLKPLLDILAEQPGWSDLPILFLTTSGTRQSETSTEILSLFGGRANITILERPIRMATLLSGVQSGLRARQRQYQVRDYIRERERDRENLLQTQKLESLGVLAGGVAHDFNNLLTGILGNSSLALEMLPDGCEEAAAALLDVISASERAADLTKQLLAYAGKGRFVISAVDLSSMVNEVLHLIHAAVAKNAFLRLDLATDLPAIEADRPQLQQVIMNLVINAAESIPEHRSGSVDLRTSLQILDEEYIESHVPGRNVSPGAYVLLEVKDSGSGMDEKTIARIFDPFFTTKFTGRGLGLAAVQGIVRGHKGVLSVESKLGEGSTFRIFFPASTMEVPAAIPGKPAALEASGKGKAILIIDDEAVIRRTAQAALKHHGYESLAADGGAAGLALFEADPERFQVVLLDLTMPGMGGEEVFSRIREIKPDAKVIVSSGYNEGEVIQRFSGKGLAGFVQKPYTAGTLVSALSKIL